MKRKKQDNIFIGAEADIRLAMYERALTGGNKKYKAKSSIKFTNLEEEKVYLYDKMQKGEASNRELVYLSLLFSMITKEQYLDFLQIEKDCKEYDEED